MATLEGGVGALATASGLAAGAIAMLTLLENGDEVVSSQNLYGGTHNQLAIAFPRFGITTRFADPHDLAAVEARDRPADEAALRRDDRQPAHRRARRRRLGARSPTRHGLPLMIDNTFATPYLCRPFEHGAHIVIHSATKFIGGHGTSIGGVIVDGGTYDWGAGRFPGLTEPSAGLPRHALLRRRSATSRS